LSIADIRPQIEAQAVSGKEFLLFGCEGDGEIFGLDTEVSIACSPQNIESAAWIFRMAYSVARLSSGLFESAAACS
jgi:hypothetical protein